MAMHASKARSVQKPYRDSIKLCQYSWSLEQFGAMEVPWESMGLRYQQRHIPEATELDHIYGKGTGCERIFNWMMCCRVAHLWKTDHTTLGRIVAMWCKIKMQTDQTGLVQVEHFNPNLICDIWGRRPIGMLQVWRETEDLPDWADKMSMDALERWEAQ